MRLMLFNLRAERLLGEHLVEGFIITNEFFVFPQLRPDISAAGSKPCMHEQRESRIGRGHYFIASERMRGRKLCSCKKLGKQFWKFAPLVGFPENIVQVMTNERPDIAAYHFC